MRLRDRIEMKKELQLQFHKEFIENYRDSQNKIFQFIGLIVSSITIFGYTSYGYYIRNFGTVSYNVWLLKNPVIIDENMLIVSYILSQVILLISIALILDAAYTFRRDQIVIYKIRKNWGWNIDEYSNPQEKGYFDWIRDFYAILLVGVFCIQIFEFEILRRLTNNFKMIFLPLISFILFWGYCRKWNRFNNGWDIFSISLVWLFYQMCPKVICKLLRRKKIDCEKYVE